MRSSSWPRAVSISTGTSERGADPAADLEAVAVGQHHVEEHRVETLLPGPRRPSAAVPAALTSKPKRPQVVGHEQRQRRVVLDHQDALAHRPHSGPQPRILQRRAGPASARGACSVRARQSAGPSPWKRWARSISSPRCSGVRTSARFGDGASRASSTRRRRGRSPPCASARSPRGRSPASRARGRSPRAAAVLRGDRRELVDRALGDAPGLLLLLVARVHAAQRALDRHAGVLLGLRRIVHPARTEAGPCKRVRLGRRREVAVGRRARHEGDEGGQPGQHTATDPEPPSPPDRPATGVGGLLRVVHVSSSGVACGALHPQRCAAALRSLVAKMKNCEAQVSVLPGELVIPEDVVHRPAGDARVHPVDVPGSQEDTKIASLHTDAVSVVSCTRIGAVLHRRSEGPVHEPRARRPRDDPRLFVMRAERRAPRRFRRNGPDTVARSGRAPLPRQAQARAGYNRLGDKR